MDNKQLQQAIQSSVPTVVDFYADWCAPCRVLAPKLTAIQNEYGEKINVLKINIDQHKEHVITYKVRGIPRLIIFKDGEIVNNMAHTGNMAVLKRQIDDVLKTTEDETV